MSGPADYLTRSGDWANAPDTSAGGRPRGTVLRGRFPSLRCSLRWKLYRRGVARSIKSQTMIYRARVLPSDRFEAYARGNTGEEVTLWRLTSVSWDEGWAIRPMNDGSELDPRDEQSRHRRHGKKSSIVA